MIEFQAGLCASCCRPMSLKHGTHVDHDHKTGKIRGLLCWRCNIGLGFIEKDPLFLDNILAYQKAHANG